MKTPSRRIGIEGRIRRTGFVLLLLGVILASTGRANATPLEVISGSWEASQFTAWDTFLSFTLSDGRSFQEISPFPSVTPFGLDQNETTVSTPEFGPQYPWSVTFHFFHEPMPRPARPDGEALVPFTMVGTLRTCSAVTFSENPPPFGAQCIDAITEDVTGHGTINWFYEHPSVNDPFPYEAVRYSFVPEPSSSLVLLGIGFAGLISWKQYLFR
jgi:hypothetical protein